MPPAENALVLPAAFLLVSLLFVCIGRPLGIAARRSQPPLRAYAFDIVGSLAGIAAFFLLSCLEQPPAVWFAGLVLIVAAALAARLARSRHHGRARSWSRASLPGSIGHELLVVALLQDRTHADRQRLTAATLNVNESGHQSMLPSDEKEPFYRAPYELFGAGQFQRALIIGAGSGSDTAIALQYRRRPRRRGRDRPGHRAPGTRSSIPTSRSPIHACTVHVDDGRSFLRKTNHKYDLIIFALPDSLTLTSQFASLRLESFLLHRGVVRGGARPPDDDGALVLYNYYREDWLLRKLAGMLEIAFGAGRHTSRATAAGAAPACWWTARACRPCWPAARAQHALHGSRAAPRS